jgi:hypothetical protein
MTINHQLGDAVERGSVTSAQAPGIGRQRPAAAGLPARQGGHMSFVTTQPGLLAARADDLAGIGSTMNAQNVAAVAPTTGVVPAAADEVSALTVTKAANAAVAG